MYCTLYILHTAPTAYYRNDQYTICLHCGTSRVYFAQISSDNENLFFFFFFIKLDQQIPGQALAVPLQCTAFLETVGVVDWSDAYWGFPLTQYTSRNFFGILQILLVFAYSILHTPFWPKYVLTASTVCSFENSL